MDARTRESGRYDAGAVRARAQMTMDDAFDIIANKLDQINAPDDAEETGLCRHHDMVAAARRE